MMRRQEALRFMGGMWVFPGGRVDPPDCGPAAAALVADDQAPIMLAPDGTSVAPGLVLGLRVAACRETYEEAGVLLVRRRDGRRPAPEQLQALAAAREGSTHVPGGFLDLVAAASLLLDVDRLVYWSHWITPSHESAPVRHTVLRCGHAGGPGRKPRSARIDGACVAYSPRRLLGRCKR